MVMQAGLRPEWLDFQVYRRVKVQMESAESVGESMRLPANLITRWVEQITLYLLTAPTTEEISPEREKRLALQLVAERIDYAVSLAFDAFARSQGKKSTWRQKGNGERTLVTVNSAGDPRWLELAIKLSDRLRDLPPTRLASVFVEDDNLHGEQFESFAHAAVGLSYEQAMALRRRYEAGEFERECQEETNPFGECSEDGGEQGEQGEVQLTATEDEIEICVKKFIERRAAEAANSRPVHSDTQGGSEDDLPDEQKAARKAFFAGGT
jgi:hypothetical protein